MSLAAGVLAGTLLGPLLFGASPDQVRETARKIVDGAQYQRELPDPGQGGLPAPDGDEAFRDNPNAPRHEAEIPPPAAGPLGFISQAIMWVLIAVAVVLVVFWLVSELSGLEKAAANAAEIAPERDQDHGPVVDKPLGDADALAQQGRFSEAIHALLLRTLEELVRRLATPLPRSMTSREILQRVRLPGDARTALAGLVTAVELSYFGNETPGEADYRTCVERFRTFATAYVQGQGPGQGQAA